MNIKAYDKIHSKIFGIRNPYDYVPYKLNPRMPSSDSTAYKLNPHYSHLYDKLFILQSQHLEGGKLSELKQKEVTYPIFIKPRYGHKTSSSKNCYKINSKQELSPHFNKKDMIWSEFIDATEGMTDFVMLNGEIVYQLTYIYSDKQYGFADVWKYISSESKPPVEIVDWVNKHLQGYTGPLNVQYRDTKIIEIGLRFARRGMYIESTEHKGLIDSINILWKEKAWVGREEFIIKPFYSFKCWSSIPVVCLLPDYVIRTLLCKFHTMNFSEYYFEPTGTRSTIFFQFLHHDFETGMKLKYILETLLFTINTAFLLGIVLMITCSILKIPCQPVWIICLVLMLFSSLNRINILYKQVTHQRQFIF